MGHLARQLPPIQFTRGVANNPLDLVAAIDAVDDTWIKVRRAGLDELDLSAVMMKPKSVTKKRSPR